MAASFAAWTKNEGLLFLAALLIAHGLMALKSRSSTGVRDFVLLLVGALPPLFVVLWFKLRLAPPGDLFTSGALLTHRLLDPHRYWVIVNWYGKEFLRFGNWGFLPETLLLVVLYFLANKTKDRRNPSCLLTGIITLSLTLIGYFAIYLITPYDLYWHLRFSLNRLFLQLWPSAVLLFFLRIPGIVNKPAQLEPAKYGSSPENHSIL
jgi:hypothetical protein